MIEWENKEINEKACAYLLSLVPVYTLEEELEIVDKILEYKELTEENYKTVVAELLEAVIKNNKE